MSKSRDPYFYRTDLDVTDDNSNPDIALSPVAVTLNKNFLWDLTARVWRKATGDYNGRTRITSGPGNNLNIIPRLVNVPAAETLILDTNPSRQGFFIDNLSQHWMYLAFRAGDINVGTWLYFPNDFSVECDGYTGQIYMQALVAADQISVTEY